MHTSSMWVKIIGNHSFNHIAKASHHSLIHFVPPKKNKKTPKTKNHRDGCQSLSARGRWRETRAPAGLIPLSVREACVPMSEDEGRRGGDRETLAAKCVA